MQFCTYFVLYVITTAVSGLQMWPRDFSRYFWGTSLVAKDWLIIDGGHVFTIDPNPEFYIFTSTFAIDLSNSWKNTSLPFINIPKPHDYPFSRRQSMWWNSYEANIYTRGGWQYATVNCNGTQAASKCNNATYVTKGHNFTADLNHPSEQVMWQLDAGFLDTGKPGQTISELWSKSPSKGRDAIVQPPKDAATNLVATADTRTHDKFWSLGGATLIDGSYVGTAYQGIIRLDIKTSSWSNLSSEYYGVGGYAAFATQSFIPNIGKEGLLVSFGGYAPPGSSFPWADKATIWLQPFDQIDVYDIESGTFFRQPASGDIPGKRYAHCAVAVVDSKSGGVDV